LACELCPRRCRTNRLSGRAGACGAGAELEVFRYGPHHGEEPPLSGTRGSGTVFFSRCTLTCLYCQNHRWSQEGQGQGRTVSELAGMILELTADGCHNINLVSPTPWLPHIAAALEEAAGAGVRPRVVYNTSGYERIETLEAYGPLVDVFLTDLRYAEAASAAEGSGRADYVEVARRALAAMWQRTGPLALDADGVAVRGTVCRILVLPGRAGEAAENLRWIARELGTDVPISLMAQYTPSYRAVGRGDWGRRITAGEYALACDELERLGFSNGWVQAFEEDPEPELAGFRMQPGKGAVAESGPRDATSRTGEKSDERA
jgi:putative pyruvate formate lyase activating enzyme